MKRNPKHSRVAYINTYQKNNNFAPTHFNISDIYAGPCTPTKRFYVFIGPAAFSVDFVLSFAISHRWSLSLTLFLFHYSQTDTFTQTRWNSFFHVYHWGDRVRQGPRTVTQHNARPCFNSCKSVSFCEDRHNALNLYPWKNEIAVSAWI